MKKLLFIFLLLFIFFIPDASYARIITSDAIGDVDEKSEYGGKYMQTWEEPLEMADLLLFSTHADDEHLFFAGILPYCVANDIKAQVVYMTNHDGEPVRNSERLNGLWAAGVRNYPIIGPFPDLYSESLKEAISVYKRQGFSEDDFITYCVSNIRRFKPQVVVGHDTGGEYGHGGHMLSAESLMQAVVLASDESYDTDSFMAYGVWDTPKTYLHLWDERKITIEIDTPLPYFDGKTAFEVSQYGFSFHKSQHWMSFYKWLLGTKESPITLSSQIKKYPPGKFGLYRTLVGEDSEGAVDLFENITLIKDIIIYQENSETDEEPEIDEFEKDEPEIDNDIEINDNEVTIGFETDENTLEEAPVNRQNDDFKEKSLHMDYILGIVLISAALLLIRFLTTKKRKVKKRRL